MNAPKWYWRRKLSALLCISLGLTCGSAVLGGQPAVALIANKSVPASTVGVAQARALLSLRMTRWPDGTPVQLFVLGDDHPLHQATCKALLGIFPYQLRQSWDNAIFTGQALPPTVVRSEAELVNLVASTPGAIGYAGKYTTHGAPDVKVLSVD